MRVFVDGEKVAAVSFDGNNRVYRGEIVKRTEKTVMVKVDGGNEKRCKIHIWYDGSTEYIFPLGQHTRIAVFKAGENF